MAMEMQFPLFTPKKILLDSSFNGFLICFQDEFVDRFKKRFISRSNLTRRVEKQVFCFSNIPFPFLPNLIRLFF